jgi:hypothetical protein
LQIPHDEPRGLVDERCERFVRETFGMVRDRCMRRSMTALMSASLPKKPLRRVCPESRYDWRVRFMAADQALQLNVDLFLLRKTVCRTRVFEILINAPTLASIGAAGAIGIAAGQPMFEDMRIRGANSARIPR